MAILLDRSKRLAAELNHKHKSFDNHFGNLYPIVTYHFKRKYRVEPCFSKKLRSELFGLGTILLVRFMVNYARIIGSI